MKFHENLNKQKFSCFSHKEYKKKRRSRDLKEREKKREIKPSIVKSINN